MNDTALSYSISYAKSSLISFYSSSQHSFNSFVTSSVESSSMSSYISSIWDLNMKNYQTTSTTGIPTTTYNYDYTSYSIKVPTKFKYCNPTTRKIVDENGAETIIPPDTCIAINASCCPCSTYSMVDGEMKNIGWGGSIDFINAKNYDEYYSKYLHNCTGFGVVCRMSSSPTGCNHVAACIGGMCRDASRY
jgi:hypothetical protein